MSIDTGCDPGNPDLAIKITITTDFIHPSGNLKLLFDLVH